MYEDSPTPSRVRCSGDSAASPIGRERRCSCKVPERSMMAASCHPEPLVSSNKSVLMGVMAQTNDAIQHGWTVTLRRSLRMNASYMTRLASIQMRTRGETTININVAEKTPPGCGSCRKAFDDCLRTSFQPQKPKLWSLCLLMKR